MIGTTAALITAGAIAGAGAIGASAISSSQQKKAAKNAAELAREQQDQALAEQQRLEEKYGLTPGELAREQRLFGIPEGDEAIRFVEGSAGLEPSQQTELERRAGLSGEELLKEVGPETASLLDKIAACSGMTGEELFRSEGGISRALADQVLAETQNPEQYYQDTLNEKLELARTMVNAEANRRGVFGGTPEGGIRFENLGRAGVDLAIKSAEGKMAARQQSLANANILSNLAAGLSSAARGEQATVSQTALSEKEKARVELEAFLQNMQNQSAASKNRAASVATSAFSTAQNTVGNAYNTLVANEMYKGNISGPLETGLTEIGKFGADYFGENLPSIVSGGSSSSGNKVPSYEDLSKATSTSSPFERLGGITGSDMIGLKKKYPYLLTGYNS